MSPKLKSFVNWSIYVVILCFIIFGVLVPFLICMVQPTLFPEADISGFKDWIQSASVWISFFSAALGGFSMWQATRSQQETKTLLETINQTINNIKTGQDELVSFLHKPNFHFSPPGSADSFWKQDTVKE